VLIGRETERERVRRVLATARDGGSAALVIRGEPGIGKTALLLEALADAKGMTVLRCRGLEAETQLPFAGLAELLGPIVALRERLPPAQAAALAGALQLEPADPSARLAIGAALLGVLSLAAERRPVLCVVDDLQWVDEPSLEALRFAVRRLGAEGVAVLMAQRSGPGGVASRHGDRAAAAFDDLAPGVATLDLAPLEAASARAFLAPGLPEAVAARVLATAAGNPLALREVPALLSPEELEGRAPLEGPLPPGATLERVLARRLEALPLATREALVVAATAEVRRGDVVVRALASAGCDVGLLEPAEAAGIVTLGPGEVAFRHPLLRAAAYHTGSTVQRRAAHRAVAHALPEDDPQRAWQLAAAAPLPDEDVAAALERAALAARARTGFAPAAHAYLRAAELSPDPVDRARRLVEAARDLLPAGHPDVGLARLEQAERVLAIADRGDVSAVATELRTLRAQLALRTGRTAEARELLVAQARRLQDDAPPAAAMLLLLVSLGAMAMRDHHGWLAHAERALALALAGEIPAGGGGADLLAALASLSAGAARLSLPDVATGRRLLARGEALLGDDLSTALALAPEIVALAAHGWLWIEEYERGVELLDRLVAAGRQSASVGALPYPLAARAQGNLFLGRYALARADAEEAVALAEQTSQDPALIIALGMLASVQAWHGEKAEATAAAERAIALGERRGVPLPTIYAKHALGFLAAASTRPERAVERLEVVRAEALPGNVLWAPHLVDAYVRAGRRDDAVALVAHYDETIADRRIAPAILERLRGLTGGGEQHFHAALALHDAGPAPFELARTQLAYGEWLRTQDRREEAREQLRTALAGFEAIAALAFADRARRELRAAGASPRAAAERDPAELTPHELRVAQLVAQGLTNREAAAALFVSAKTVEHHLRSVFRKLGIRRRAELARLMAAR
jgi:DNA-binding CsgD family transcriptional regulator